MSYTVNPLTGQLMPTATGPQGPQGPQGPAGATGAAGASWSAIADSVTITGNATLTATNLNKIHDINSSSAMTLTLPQASTEDIAIGAVFAIYRRGSGSITFAVQGSDTLESASGATTIASQYQMATVWKRAQGVWVLMGAIQ
ncbi:MAG: hypothetical protein HQL66_03320 [Magnetococcales bacterium]|nr:hypothetical protein [Magnetococcales bacterium]